MNRKGQKLVKRLCVYGGLLLTLFVVLAFITSPTKNMTFRQKLLHFLYPGFMRLSSVKQLIASGNGKSAPVSFYSLKATKIDGQSIDFHSLKGKKVLIVNTASDCGYTPQYAELQRLFEEQKGKLVILGFPSNDYKEQEKGNNDSIASFCKQNYGVTFTMMQKIITHKQAGQDPVYQWLTDSSKNGWNNRAPKWNFSKYLINEEGQLQDHFDPSVSPLSKEFLSKLSP
jgi:glutathione peroxidase